MEEWKVVYGGGFWGEEGCKCEEIVVNKPFTWEKENWLLTSVYFCDEGLVADFCVEIDLAELKAFFDKWNFAEIDYRTLSQDELEAIQTEQPMNLSFRSSVICNGKKLESESGSSISYLPKEFHTEEYARDEEVEKVLKHYKLDEGKAWMFWRCSYRWEEKAEKINSLEITFVRDAKKYAAEPVGELTVGKVVEITHPTTGQNYKLTVLEINDSKVDQAVFNNPDMEYPTNFKTITYSVDPKVDFCFFVLQDLCKPDYPRMIKQANDGQAAAFAVVGGSRRKDRMNAENVRSSCSSVHFDEAYEVNWVPVFFVKEMEELTVRFDI